MTWLEGMNVRMLRTARPGSTGIASTHSGSESREGTSSSGSGSGGEEAGRGLGDGLTEHGCYGYGYAFAVMDDKVGKVGYG